MDVIGLPLPCRFIQVVCGKDEVGFALAESIGKTLYEAVPCILSDDLTHVPLIGHDVPSRNIHLYS